MARRGVLLRRNWHTTRTSAVVLLLLATALLAFAGYHEARHQWVQARASALVRHASGEPGSVARCQRFTPALLDLSQNSGFVAYDDLSVAALERTECNDLADWLQSSKNAPSAAQVRAVHVVVHEAMHVAGDLNEATAECAAMQLDADAAVFLGATPEQARALAASYYRDTYPYLRDGYVTGSCGPEQELDRTPGDGRFP